MTTFLQFSSSEAYQTWRDTQTATYENDPLLLGQSMAGKAFSFYRAIMA